MDGIKTNAASGNSQKSNYIHYPLVLSVAGKKILLNSLSPEDWGFNEIFKLVKNEKRVCLKFYSSQAPFVLKAIHRISDIFIKDVSFKIDPLLRELVKNAEKENATIIAKKAGLIKPDELHAPLDLMGKILKEKLQLGNSDIPLLYHYPEISVNLNIFLKDNLLYFEIENYGNINPSIQKMVENKIKLGCELSDFDLRQEFEMRPYSELSVYIKNLFLPEYSEDRFENLWGKTFDESFDDYWNSCPYFLLMSAGTHTSFYPYYATVYQQLRSTFKKEEEPDNLRFSAGMGYIQCAFVIEANRSIYGTYGKVNVPYSSGNKTIASFIIGMPHMEVEI